MKEKRVQLPGILIQSVFSYLIAIETAFLKLLEQLIIDKNIKNHSSVALDFVKLALLGAPEKQFQ